MWWSVGLHIQLHVITEKQTWQRSQIWFKEYGLENAKIEKYIRNILQFLVSEVRQNHFLILFVALQGMNLSGEFAIGW